MKLNTEPIKNWFGFSRRERRATFILLIIIVMMIVVRYALPESRISVRDVTGDFISPEELAGFYQTENKQAPESLPYSRKDGYQVKYNQKKSSDYKTVNASGKPLRRDNSFQHSSGQQKTLIDINLSDSATLIRLPGIGPVLSARIIKYRRLLGGFARVEQLKEVYGLPPETYEVIKERVFTDSTFIKRININNCEWKDLARIPYFEKYEVTAILKYRKLTGKINNIVDLTDNKLITSEKASKIRPYLKFDE
jgi:DNA uptake protein ComE-like DNA-binding protein